MKIAVIADIHSNIYALKVAYEYIKKENIKKVFVLGDIISDCPYPNKVMKLLDDWSKVDELIFIKGNREEYLLNFNPNAKTQLNMGSIKYTYDNLDKKYIEEIKKYPTTYKTNILDTTFFCAHGSSLNTRELLFPRKDNTKKYMDSVSADIILCGHSHNSFIYYYNNKVLINPGCLGHYSNNNKTANFCTIELSYGKISIDEIALPYSSKKLLEDFTKSGLESLGGPYTKAIMHAFKTGDFFASEMLDLGSFYGGKESDYIKAYDEIIKRYKNGKRSSV